MFANVFLHVDIFTGTQPLVSRWTKNNKIIGITVERFNTIEKKSAGSRIKEWTMAELNFKCRKCKVIFDCNVGEITFPQSVDQRPKFKNEIICPECGKLSMDEVLLTEIGQTQMTVAHLGTVN